MSKSSTAFLIVAVGAFALFRFGGFFNGSGVTYDEFVEQQARENPRLSNGVTRLMAAVARRDFKQVRQFLAKGIGGNVNDQSDEGLTALMLAAGLTDSNGFGFSYDPDYVSSSSFIEALHHAGARVDVKDKEGKTALFYAAKLDIGSDSSTIQQLIDYGADVNAVDKHGRTPLFYAAEAENSSTVLTLLENGARMDVVDHQGTTPLMMSVVSDRGCLELMLLENPNLEAKDAKGRTALSHAAEQGSHRCVSKLLEAGAQCNTVDSKGHSPLFLASMGKGAYHEKTALLLIEKGADINTLDHLNNSILHVAAERGHVALFEELLKRGADVTVINSKGISVLALPNKERYACFRELLVKYGHQPRSQEAPVQG